MSNSDRKKMSDIWCHFTSLPDKFATCNFCKQKLSFKTSITNLRRHLNCKHPTVLIPTIARSSVSTQNILRDIPESQIENMQDEAGPSSATFVADSNLSDQNESVRKKRMLQSSVKSYIPKKMPSTQKNRIDFLIMKLFIKDYQPFSMVEDEGFRDLITEILPNYEIPSRRYFSETILDNLYETATNELKEKLVTVKGVCITTDHWTSSANESYMGVTVHYIDQEFNMCSNLLECIRFEGSHTASAIAEELHRIVNNWGLISKVLITLTDNASNVTSAVEKVLLWKHYGCFAHKLNLVVQSALTLNGNENTIVNGLIKKVKNIVAHFKRSSQATEKFLKMQLQMGSKSPLRLIQDVVTRWNSTFHMLERCVLLQEALRSTIANLNAPNLEPLSEEEWEVAAQLCLLLRPFDQATQEMSGEKYLTGSKIIVISRGLTRLTEKAILEKKCEKVEAVASHLVKEMNQRFRNLEHSLTIAVCTFLDPRFKFHVFDDQNAIKNTQQYITDSIISLMEKKRTITSQNIEQTPQTSTEQWEKQTYWDEFDLKISEIQPSTNSRTMAIMEVQRYISDRVLNRKEDPLTWWKTNKDVYPNLSHLVLSKCCMVATTVPCERLFSKAKNILTERRSRLSHTKVGKLLFLNS